MPWERTRTLDNKIGFLVRDQDNNALQILSKMNYKDKPMTATQIKDSNKYHLIHVNQSQLLSYIHGLRNLLNSQQSNNERVKYIAKYCHIDSCYNATDISKIIREHHFNECKAFIE